MAGVTALRLSHSATANITGGETPNRTEMIWASARRRDHIGYPATNLVDKKGIILPLNDLPILQMVAEVRLERTSLAYETKLESPPVYSAMKCHLNGSGRWNRTISRSVIGRLLARRALRVSESN